MNISSVQEIIPWTSVTKIPQAPEFVEGLINLRGNAIPVIDLRKRFGLPNAEIGRETRVVVVNVHNLTIGLVVDAVAEVQNIQSDSIMPASSIVSGVSTEFIRGIAKVDGPIILLSIDHLFGEIDQLVLRSCN